MIRMVYDNVAQYGDLDRTGDKNLIDDLDLETAVQISILTEARAKPGDEPAGILGYQGGWWGDAADGVGDSIGSRMWLLRRAKATNANINRAREYLEECLQWMIQDGVTASPIMVATWRGKTPISLGYSIKIERPNALGPWSRAWETQFNEF